MRKRHLTLGMMVETGSPAQPQDVLQTGFARVRKVVEDLDFKVERRLSQVEQEEDDG